MFNKAFTPLLRPHLMASMCRQVWAIAPMKSGSAHAFSSAPHTVSIRFASGSKLLPRTMFTSPLGASQNFGKLVGEAGWRSSYSRYSYRHVLLASATAIATLTPTDEETDKSTPHFLVPVSGTETREAGLYLASRQDQERASRGLNKQNPSTIYLWYKRVIRWFYKFCYNPVTTCLRFVQLAALFGPVILTLPVVLVGPKVVYGIDRDDGIIKDDNSTSNDRAGAVWWYKYLTWTMEMAGPSFIKLGQWAASRSDIFPQVLCTELSKLHSNAKKHSLSATKRTLEEAFDRKFEDIFQEFIEEPIGVGAIAQVYKARLADDLIDAQCVQDKYDENLSQHRKKRDIMGMIPKPIQSRIMPQDINPFSDWVAIKVLHPRVAVVVERDLAIMRFFAQIINTLPTMEWLSLPGEVAAFGDMMRQQMDLRIEASNLDIFRQNFANSADIKFPKPYKQFCSRKVLVEEFISAIPMPKFLNNCGGKGGGTSESMNKRVSSKGLDAFLKMLLLDNFIHADLHPGNIYVRLYKKGQHNLGDFVRGPEDPITSQEIEKVTQRLNAITDIEVWNKEVSRLDAEGYYPQICFIDVGLITELNNVNRRNFIDLFKAIAEFDGYRVGELMIERSRTPETAIDPEIFELKTQRLVHNIKARTFALGNVKVGDLLSQMLGMVRQHHVRMESDFITIVLSILLLEGIGRTLDPGMDLFKR